MDGFLYLIGEEIMAQHQGDRKAVLTDLIHYLKTLQDDGALFIDGEIYHLPDKIELQVRAGGTRNSFGLTIWIGGLEESFTKPVVSIIMGSQSDRDIAKKAEDTFEWFGVPYETVILSAHRTPAQLRAYLESAERRGIRIFLCIAGMAAHLPGVVASETNLPVIGVPVDSGILQGLDALFSIQQMPPGIPVAGVGVNAGANAALLAIRMLQFDHPFLSEKLEHYMNTRREKILKSTPWLPAVTSEGLRETHLDRIPLIKRGKVRDIYDLGDRILLVATDRISVFDVVLPTPIPDKGRILTALSAFWFWRFRKTVKNHLISVRYTDLPGDLPAQYPFLDGRVMIVKKLKPLPVECIVRGYLAGSGWKQYKETGKIHDVELPQGLKESDKLPHPVFTPTTKAESGHDMPMTQKEFDELVGSQYADRIRHLSIQIYSEAAEYAYERGIIIADTKFEFGVDDDGTLYLIDEILTPDSSRFWPLELYEPGKSQPSFDKQYVRDYTAGLGWNKTYPGPELPPEVVRNTQMKYWEAYRRLVPV